jgi:hypothetical protein
VALDQHLVGAEMRDREVENADPAPSIDDSAKNLLHRRYDVLRLELVSEWGLRFSF